MTRGGMARLALVVLGAAATWQALPAQACSAYSCDGVGWQSFDPARPGVMAAYQAARREGTVEALEAFVRDYPGSPAASEALDLIETLKRAGDRHASKG